MEGSALLAIARTKQTFLNVIKEFKPYGTVLPHVRQTKILSGLSSYESNIIECCRNESWSQHSLIWKFFGGFDV